MSSAESTVTPLGLPGAFTVKPKEFHDERGDFYKFYDRQALKKMGIKPHFVEDYLTISKKGVVRGLHYQLDPFAQAKFLRCIKGQVFDVMVDMRKSSPTFGKWVSVLLSEENKLSVYIPRGFAHGLLSLTEGSMLAYKADNDYSAEHERILLWNDEKVGIQWPKCDNYIVSKKDAAGLPFDEADKMD